jgi:aminoglycoside phosphotransferase (APT) family kinase protein
VPCDADPRLDLRLGKADDQHLGLPPADGSRMGHAPIIPRLERMRQWMPELTVDEGLARRLIARQFPEVGVGALRLLGEGWDNTVWLVDERWVFRFPRRAVAIPGVEREMTALRRIAPLVPLPIPEPVFLGRPDDEFPWPFFGAPFVRGREPLGLDDAARTALGRPLAEFLRALHGAPVDGDLPDDPMGRADMAIRVSKAAEQVADAEEAGIWRAPDSVERYFAAAADLSRPEPTTILHGDLHFRHLLVDEHDRLAGVIDWGDLCRGDPSIDLSLLWSFFPRNGRSAFLDAYGPVTADQLLRARVLALCLCAVLALYAHHEGMVGVEGEALDGLERTVA